MGKADENFNWVDLEDCLECKAAKIFHMKGIWLFDMQKEECLCQRSNSCPYIIHLIAVGHLYGKGNFSKIETDPPENRGGNCEYSFN